MRAIKVFEVVPPVFMRVIKVFEVVPPVFMRAIKISEAALLLDFPASA